MAKDVLITPLNGAVEFKDTSVTQASIYELNGDLHLDSTSGDIVVGDGTPANVEIGDAVTAVSLTLLGGGDISSSGNALDIGVTGDIINLNVAGVTYNLPSNIVTTTDYTAENILTKIKTVDGAGSGLDADTLDGLSTSSTNIASTIVARDASGNFSAGTITANLSGIATSANLVNNTNLGSTSLTSNTTTNTAAAWAALPVGYSSFMSSSIGTVGGLPVSNYGYFHKVANRDTAGGWGGIWISYSTDQNYVGRAADSTSMPTWNKLLIDGGAGSITGNAGTATKLATARTIAISGDAVGTATSFDGSANISIATTLSNSGVVAGTYNDSTTSISPITVDSKGRVTGVGAAVTVTPAWNSITSKPTTLAGYGITDAANSSHTHSTYQPIDNDLTAIADLAGTSGLLKKTAVDTWTLDTSSYLTSNQSITYTGDVTGSGNTSVALTLADSGVVAGTYNNSTTAITPITVDSKGRVTNVGSNVVITPAWGSITSKPTTISGYGITDAPTVTGTGATGTWGIGITGNAVTATKTTATVTGTNSADLVYGNMGDNDQARIRIGATASNAGYLEIATADDGTEPIYVRQYTGTFTSVARTLTLLDGSGNTSLPGDLSVSGGISKVKFKPNTVNGNLGYPSVEEMALFHGQFNNKFRFIPATTQEESTDGISWIASSRASTNALKDIMLGEGQTAGFNAIPAMTVGGSGYYRLTWNASSTGYVYLNAFYAYCSTNGNNVTFTIEAEHNVSGWVTLVSGTKNNWPGHIYIPHGTIPFRTTDTDKYKNIRITFAVTSAANTNPISLNAIEWFGGYPAGKRNVETYDRDKNVSFPANISGSQLVSNIASGSSPLVVTSNTLVPNLNSDLLDGQEGSYYLDWTNATNKPDPTITVTLTGDVTGTANTTLTDLASGTVTVNTSIGANSVALGTDTTGDYVSTVNVSGTGLSVSGGTGEGSTPTITSNATNLNTVSTIVARDASGNFSAGTITASLSGNASTASKLSTARTISATGDATWSVSFDGSADGSAALTLANSGVTAGVYNSSASSITPFTIDSKGRITATGAEVTITPSFASITSKPTTLAGYGITDALLASAYTAADVLTKIKTVDGATSGLDADLLDGQEGSFYLNATNINSGTIDDAYLPTSISSDITGNAASASKLATARSVTLTGDVTGTVSFDGSVDVSINTTIGANSVALGSDTTGNYVSDLTSGNGITITGSGTESATPTIALDSTANVQFASVTTPVVKATGGIIENAATISANYTISTGNNALSAGPITIADLVTVTIPDGSTWTVV